MNKNERLKTMVLFVLMFVGVNYSLFVFSIEPRLSRLESARSDFNSSSESQDFKGSLEDEIDSLNTDIQFYGDLESRFAEKTASNIDTLQIAYDFYMFSHGHGVSAEELEIRTGSLEDYYERDDFTDSEVDEEESNQRIQITEIESTSDNQEIVVAVPIELKMAVKDDLLDGVLEDMENLIQEHISVTGFTAEVNNDYIGSMEDEANLETTTQTDTLQVVFEFEYYIDIEAFQRNRLTAYDFYQGLNGHESFDDLFQGQLENTTSENRTLINNDEEVDE